MTTRTKSVVLLSGGVDSTTLLAERIDSGREVLPISFHYGQRHSRELESAYAVCRHYGLDRGPQVAHVTVLADLLWPGGLSSQVGTSIDVPHGHYADESMRVTVIPNRNMVLIALSTAYAIANGAAEVAYAAHAGDHAIYPDCRPEYIRTMMKAVALCDYPERTPTLLAPFMNLTKEQIVRLGASMSVPYELTYSCYEGKGEHCGRCGTCVERREAFELAGVVDPTVYRSSETLRDA